MTNTDVFSRIDRLKKLYSEWEVRDGEDVWTLDYRKLPRDLPRTLFMYEWSKRQDDGCLLLRKEIGEETIKAGIDFSQVPYLAMIVTENKERRLETYYSAIRSIDLNDILLEMIEKTTKQIGEGQKVGWL